jgi:hypothetical protein
VDAHHQHGTSGSMDDEAPDLEAFGERATTICDGLADQL